MRAHVHGAQLIDENARVSRRVVVGWCVAEAESAALSKPLFLDAAAKQGVSPGQLAPTRAMTAAFL
jgi:hypothetical protein